MCGIDDRGDLVARHVARGTALETVSGTGEKLDRLCAAADFLTNLPAQCFRSVDEQVDAGRLRGSPPIRAVVEIGGGADVVTAGADARSGNDVFGNRDLELCIDEHGRASGREGGGQ